MSQEFGAAFDTSVFVYALARQTLGGGHLLGTGFSLGGRRVATAYHVFGGSDEGAVLLIPRISNLNTYQDSDNIPVLSLRIAAADPVRDLCILEVPDGNHMDPSYTVTGSDSVGVGEPVVTLGVLTTDVGDGRACWT